MLSSRPSSTTTTTASWFLNAALQSPLWKYVMVPVARQKIIDTAQQNGIPWTRCKEWLLQQDGPWNERTSRDDPFSDADQMAIELSNIPDWYNQAPYHAYATGHLSWEAAVELELASAAIGARNMPSAGRQGERVFRTLFYEALVAAGAALPTSNQQTTGEPHANIIRVLDVGCGTGTSTRFLANQYPHIPTLSILGIDMSPYFVRTARRLMDLVPAAATAQDLSNDDDSNKTPWVCDILPDSRIQYQWGNFAGSTNTMTTNNRNDIHAGTTHHDLFFADNSVDVVNIQFVAHELPVTETIRMLQEAFRILKPNGGQLWFCEMDFQSPAYMAQRSNPLLFSLIRATEPYLDEYADGQEQIWMTLRALFATVTVAPATGRHFSCVAVKGDISNSSTGIKKDINANGVAVDAWNDLRFDEVGSYRVSDTHLQLWESKQQQ